MQNAESILVVVLATFLAISLLCTVILLVKSIQIVNQIKRITDKAEALVDKAESVGEFFQQTTGKFAVGKLLSHLASTVFDREKKHNQKEK